MCVASMVGDHYTDKWNGVPIQPYTQWPNMTVPFVPVGRPEFELLRKEVQEMIALMKRAKQYDVDNNEPECEVEDKIALLRDVSASVGIDFDKATAI
jgi:hypothetical protein